jgi:glycosyltransferase involved in cell wall biosynthesis
VILNAVDLEKFSPDGPAADLDALSGLAPAQAGTVRVGLVATFSRWKGHDTFLRAVAALPAASPIRAYVIGGAMYDTEGSQYTTDELRRLVTALGAGSRVGFTGFVRDPERVMRALDVVVHASTAPEPFGLVIAEAMACGRAVITSGTGGAAELVRDGEDALVHRAGDSAGLAARMHLLAAEPARRASMGRAARATAVKRFDARRLGEQFAAAYEAARMHA